MRNNTLVKMRHFVLALCGCLFFQTSVVSQTLGNMAKPYVRDPSAPKLGTLDGHKWVDLGLPSGTLWATHNIGAVKSSDPGHCFAWGETRPKRTFTTRNYKFFKHSGQNYRVTKYGTRKFKITLGNGVKISGCLDGKVVLDAEDDAATVNWGKKWRMPTPSECRELVWHCRWELVSSGGKDVYKIIGPNGAYIIVPIRVNGRRCNTCWTKYGCGYAPFAKCFTFDRDCLQPGTTREVGFAIRPVVTKRWDKEREMVVPNI